MKSWREILGNIDTGRHAVQYYSDEWFLARKIGFYVHEGLMKNQNSVLICTREHAFLFEKAIYQITKRSPDDLKKEGKLTILSAEEALSLFMENGFPDKNKFEFAIGRILDKAGSNGKLVRAYGEMVNLLWRRGQRGAALQLENCWNQLLKFRSVFLLCAYAVDDLSLKTYDGDFDNACHCHDTVWPAQDFEKFHRSVEEAMKEILGDYLFAMVADFALTDDPRANVPETQKYLLWLSRHMPITIQKIFAKINSPASKVKSQA